MVIRLQTSNFKLSANSETVMSAGDIVMNVEAIDARAAGTLPNHPLEARHRFRVALGGDFDAAVRQIAHPALDAFARGRVLGEEPEADGLDAPADEKPPRDAHAER